MPTIAYAAPPGTTRDLHIWVEVADGAADPVAYFVLAREGNADWSVRDEDGNSSIEQNGLMGTPGERA